MAETLQIFCESKRLDVSASYCSIVSLFEVLGSGAVQDSSTQIYQEPGESAPVFGTLLEILKPTMQQRKSPMATRSEFKPTRENKNDSLKQYFRNVSIEKQESCF